MKARAWIVAAGVVAFVGLGCVIVTGGTDEYKPYPVCTKADDCPDNTICCLDVNYAAATAVAHCHPGACPNFQLCATTSECVTQTCILQTCSVGDASSTASGCGLFAPAYCVAIEAGADSAAAADSAPDSAPDSADAGSE
jgi:hypothetical protein